MSLVVMSNHSVAGTPCQRACTIIRYAAEAVTLPYRISTGRFRTPTPMGANLCFEPDNLLLSTGILHHSRADTFGFRALHRLTFTNLMVATNGRFQLLPLHTFARYPDTLCASANENPIAAVSPLWIAFLCYTALCGCQSACVVASGFRLCSSAPDWRPHPLAQVSAIPFAHRVRGRRGEGVWGSAIV